MKLSEPIGDASYGPLLMRIPLGAYFVMAGLKKLEDIPGFLAEVHKANILPHELATLYGVLLPYAEIGAGALVCIGLWTTLGGLLTSLMLTSFIVAIGPMPTQSGLFNKDFILLGISLALMYVGGGALSVDRFRKSG